MRAILMYHSIDDSGSVISLREEVFRQQVRFLASGAVRTVGLAQLLALPPHEEAVALTFDDGFANFETTALPHLAAHGIPATVFVVSEHAGGRNAWEAASPNGIPLLPLLDWERLGRIAERGIEIGAHTRHHRQLTRLSADEVRDEIGGSVARIAGELGRRPAALAYPYGGVNAAVASEARALVAHACTTTFRALRAAEDPVWLPRLDMYYFRRPGQLEAWGSPAFRRRLWMRAQGRRVRRMVFEPGAR